MPTFPIYNNIGDLYNYLVTRIAGNNAQLITGVIHQEANLTIAFSLLNILLVIPGSTVNLFPPWDAAELYEGGIETVVRHNNKLWLFVGTVGDIGTVPGINSAIWREISAVELAHFVNQDQYLDFGGPYQVSAQEIREWLDTGVATPTLAEVLQASDPFFGRLTISSALIRSPFQLIHSAPGVLMMSLALYGHYRAVLSANAVFNYAGASDGGEYLLTIVATASVAITWAASAYSALPGITLPSAMTAGQRWHIRFVSIDARLCAVQSGLITNI